MEDMISGGGRGMGLRIRPDLNVLRTLAHLQPGDTFNLKYTLESSDSSMALTATLQVRLDDPSGLFAGHSVVAVLGNLLAQVMEARLGDG